MTILSCNMQVSGVGCVNSRGPCELLVLSLGAAPVLLCLEQADSFPHSLLDMKGSHDSFLFSGKENNNRINLDD